jgi:hypothetical protein
MAQVQHAPAGADEAANTNAQTILTNAPEVVNAGKQAASAWNSADRQNTKGDQLAIFALFQAFHKISLLANVFNRKGEIEDTIMFELKDLATEPKNEDGNRNNKVISARTNAIAQTIFGIEPSKVDQAFKNRLSRAMVVVFYFAKLGYQPDDVELTEKNKQVMLRLPFTALHSPPAPDKDGKVDEEELDHYNRLKDSKITLDGKTKDKISHSVAELQRKANPPRPREGANDTTPQDKGQAFRASLSMTVATLHQVSSPESESDIAFNKETRLQLWDLHQLLTRYFEEIEPLDKEEEGELEKKKANAKK